jgi:hypothetical protein
MQGMMQNMMKGKGGSTSTSVEHPKTMPDWCLVRFLDVTVQPGLTYQYKVQLRLANPLFNRKDLAVSEEATRQPEILGPEQLLTTRKGEQTVPLNVRVPADMYFYAVDEKPPHVRYVMPVDKDRTAIQVHRWVTALQLNAAARVPVGQWLIIERILARRGEFIGQPERVEVPVWNPGEDKFLFASSDTGKKITGRRRKGVQVDFTTNNMLVDFEGGKRSETINDHAVTDTAPVEMLVMTDSGRLVVRNGATDAADKDRKARVEAYHKEVDAVKQALDDEKNNNTGTAPGGKNNPFNLGGPGGKGR